MAWFRLAGVVVCPGMSRWILFTSMAGLPSWALSLGKAKMALNTVGKPDSASLGSGPKAQSVQGGEEACLVVVAANLAVQMEVVDAKGAEPLEGGK